MNEIIQFVGSCATDWLSAPECLELKSPVQLYRFRDQFSVVIPGFGTVTIPRGFVTDFASIPAIALSYVSTEHPALNFPAAFHDFGYSMAGKVHPDQPAQAREWVDDRFREMLIACGMRSSQAWVLHRCVRMFGGSHWNKA